MIIVCPLQKLVQHPLSKALYYHRFLASTYPCDTIMFTSRMNDWWIVRFAQRVSHVWYWTPSTGQNQLKYTRYQTPECTHYQRWDIFEVSSRFGWRMEGIQSSCRCFIQQSSENSVKCRLQWEGASRRNVSGMKVGYFRRNNAISGFFWYSLL